MSEHTAENGLPENPTVRRVHIGSGSHIEPEYDQAWSDLEKLRWHAAVAALDSGVRVLVHPIQGGYSVQVGNSSMSAMPFDFAWTYINGVSVGAEQTRPIPPGMTGGTD